MNQALTVAYHEAGHAVALHHLRRVLPLSIHAVNITPNGDRLGSMRYNLTDKEREHQNKLIDRAQAGEANASELNKYHRRMFDALAVITLAGLEAEKLIPQARATVSSRDDLEHAEWCIKGARRDRRAALLKAYTTRLVRARRESIRELAGELMRKRWLLGGEVMELLTTVEARA